MSDRAIASITTTDRIINSGGEIVAEGSPEDVVRVARSYTRQFLKSVPGRGARRGK